jgi:hypothetical protein
MARIDRTLSAEDFHSPVAAQIRAPMRHHLISSRLIGALFLAAFVFYGVGTGLVTSLLTAPDFLSTVFAQQATLVLGTFLMLVNSVVVVGLGARWCRR